MLKEDSEIVALIKEDDPAGYDKFRKKYEPYILRYTDKHRLGHLVRDHLGIVDNIIKRLFSYIQRNDIWNLQALVSKATYRKIYDDSEKDSKKSEAPLSDKWENFTPSDNPGPEDLLIDIEEPKTTEYLKICLQRLTKIQREVVDYILQGMRQTEIARIRGTSEPAVSELKKKAFEKLRICIYELQGI